MPTPHEALTNIWADRMPITTALGIVVAELDDRHLTLAMPLSPNRNHKGTVFAGSLSALATLTGWSAVWLRLRSGGEEAHIVIQDAQIHYLAPTRSDVTASTDLPDDTTWQRVLKSLGRRGRARLTLSAEMRDASGAVVARFSGRYVVHRDATPVAGNA
jgi:thioesterase domain-containing protein